MESFHDWLRSGSWLIPQGKGREGKGMERIRYVIHDRYVGGSGCDVWGGLVAAAAVMDGGWTR